MNMRTRTNIELWFVITKELDDVDQVKTEQHSICAFLGFV